MTHTPPPTQDDLAAGRELDAEIATKIMGWHKVGKYLGPSADSFGSPTEGATRTRVPRYSTDIATAWQVLDEMVWRVGTADIRLDMEDYGRGAGTNGKAERAVWVTIGEHTVCGPAPLAICRAALAAIQESH